MALWSVLYHVDPLTITLALPLFWAAAVFLAWRRPPMRGVTVPAAIVSLLILAAPLSGPATSGESGRVVAWDPLLSFEGIGGSKRPEAFGVTLQNGDVIHHLSEGPAFTDRVEEGPWGTETFFVHEEVEGGLVVTDVGGGVVEPESPAGAAALETVAEELAWQEAYAAKLEEEWPWGTTGGLALQERVLNTLLFVPVGVAAFFAFSSWSARPLFGPGPSLSIEATQWATASGRPADTGDLLGNSVGALVGTLMALLAAGLTSLVRAGGMVSRVGDPRP